MLTRVAKSLHGDALLCCALLFALCGEPIRKQKPTQDHTHEGNPPFRTGIGTWAGTCSGSPAGRVESVKNPLGFVTTQGYDLAGRQETVTNPLGHVSTTVYDAAGRVEANVDPEGNRTTLTYYDDGQQKAVENPLGFRSTTTYEIPISSSKPCLKTACFDLWRRPTCLMVNTDELFRPERRAPPGRNPCTDAGLFFLRTR